MRGVALAAVLLPSLALAQAHQHGRSTVMITFEGKRLAIEVVAPGPDIVGYERPPQSAAEQQALAAAVALLKTPSALIDLPAAARCTLDEAEVTVEGYDAPAAGAPAAAHTEFEAAYMFTCVDPSAIRVIGFPFFAKFPNSAELEVTLVTDRGPTVYEVTRDKPRVDRGNALWRWLTGR
ncbi:MAG: DUF2796 domain-containing protein [Actinobacteria bacterium]|nr:DUF2796 domain-containing protein [Actinomycetota bacterium]